MYNEYEQSFNHGEEGWIKYSTENNNISNSAIINIENEISADIFNLYNLIDDIFDNRKDLINRKENSLIETQNFYQTEFGNALKNFLIKITFNCKKYIVKLFVNRNDSNWYSAIDCWGRKEISKLYDYLKDEKFTAKSLRNKNLEELKNIKTELREKLKSYLVKICQYSKDIKVKDLIQNFDIPIDNGINNLKWTLPSPPTVYNKEWKEYNDRINKHNEVTDVYREDFVDKNGYNPWANPRHANTPQGIGGEKQSGSGNTKITKTIKKEILGKERCIYKKSGDRKEYVKHKGDLITVSEYKKIMIAKNKK
jgi:hypothetical protein